MSVNQALDNKLLTFLEHKVISASFIDTYKPHIIMFGDLPFLDIIFKDGKWLVFNHYNANKEYSRLLKKLDLDTISYKISGMTSLHNPICKELFYLGVAPINNKKELSRCFDCIYQLYSYFRLAWMEDYQNIRCFKIHSDQSVIQVSLSKIAMLEGVNEESFSFKEEHFNMFTPTLSDEDYKKNYDYNP